MTLLTKTILLTDLLMPGKSTKRVHCLLWFLLFALCFLITACGEAADTSGLSGSYVLVSVEDSGMLLPADTVRSMDLHIRLDPDGGGVVSKESEEGSLIWRINADRLSIRLGATELSGHLEGSDLVLQPLNSAETLRFSPEASVSGTGSNPGSVTDDFSVGEDWYGWWKTERSDGQMPVSWYDCCASFSENDDGTVLMTVWDEDGSRDDPLGGILFERSESGELVSINGYFLFDGVEAGEWRFQIPETELYFDAYRHSGKEEEFSYSIYLRPWGTVWDDKSEEQLPFYYEDWYLPLIREKKPMPDRIPWEKLEAERVS